MIRRLKPESGREGIKLLKEKSKMNFIFEGLIAWNSTFFFGVLKENNNKTRTVNHR
jgi:hypothetical protein